jgi:hypothetical protein
LGGRRLIVSLIGLRQAQTYNKVGTAILEATFSSWGHTLASMATTIDELAPSKTLLEEHFCLYGGPAPHL